MAPIAEDDPRAGDVTALLARHLAFAHATTAPEDVFALDVDALVDPDVAFFSYRDDDGAVLGVGALKRLDDAHAEIKSMHTAQEARGRGVGRAMVEHLLAVARERGFARVSLETGAGPAFAPARGALRPRGLRRRAGAFGRLCAEREQRVHDAGALAGPPEHGEELVLERVARASTRRPPGRAGWCGAAAGPSVTSSPITRRENARRRVGEPAAPCSVSMLNATASPGSIAQPTIGHASRSASMSGTSSSVPSSKTIGVPCTNERGMNHVPSGVGAGDELERARLAPPGRAGSRTRRSGVPSMQ